METKICFKCLADKPLDEFKEKKRGNRIYISGECILCFKKRDSIKNRKNHLKKCNTKEYKDRIKTNNRNYYLANKKEIIKQAGEHKKVIRNNNPLIKLQHGVTQLIRNSFKYNNYKKDTRTEQILGCSFQEFKTYLESKFEPWMNWYNKGNWKGVPIAINESWDIDHIIPLASATCEADIIKLNHYSNLQPLCSYTNRYIKKGKGGTV